MVEAGTPAGATAEVVRAMVAMFATGKMLDLDATVHPDYLDHQGLGGVPIRGPDGFATVVRAARSGYRELDVTIEDLVQDEDRAAVRLRWRGTRLSGEHVDRETVDIVRVEHGRAVEHWGGRS